MRNPGCSQVNYGGLFHWVDDKCLNSMEKIENFTAENVGLAIS